MAESTNSVAGDTATTHVNEDCLYVSRTRVRYPAIPPGGSAEAEIPPSHCWALPPDFSTSRGLEEVRWQLKESSIERRVQKS